MGQQDADDDFKKAPEVEAPRKKKTRKRDLGCFCNCMRKIFIYLYPA